MLKDNIKLRDYQENILNDLKCVPSIGLFLKTGAGKTLMSLKRFFDNPTNNVLIICTQPAISQWWSEIEEKTDMIPIKYKLSDKIEKRYADIIKGIKDDKIKRKCVVVNFDILYKLYLEPYINEDWTIIVDESHKIKNEGTPRKKIKVTEKCLILGELTPYKIILTATPTEKNYGGYIDYYTQLKFLGYLDITKKGFENNYCIMEKKQYPGVPYPIPDIVGYRMDRIERDIFPILKSTCRSYSPKYGDYEPQEIKIILEKAPNYNRLLKQRAYKDISFDNLSAFRIGKQTLISGNISGTDEYGNRFTYNDNTIKIDWLEDFLLNTDEVVCILYNYNVELDLIVKLCEKINKKFVVINGGVNDKYGELKKEYDVVIGQYQAISESLDGLQHKCHLMVYYSLPNSSLLYNQSKGRIDRIGQTKVPTYYFLVMKGTNDEGVWYRIKNKLRYSEHDIDMLEM